MEEVRRDQKMETWAGGGWWFGGLWNCGWRNLVEAVAWSGNCAAYLK